MTTFEVDDMTCGYCTSKITNAVHALDPSAKVRIDLPSHRVEIASAGADDAALSRAIVGADYAPVSNKSDAVIPSPTKKAAGCCCS